MGFSIGFVHLCLFGTYALTFWYGAVLIMEEGSGYSIGVVLTVFFSAIIGAFGIAQVKVFELRSEDSKRTVSRDVTNDLLYKVILYDLSN